MVMLALAGSALLITQVQTEQTIIDSNPVVIEVPQWVEESCADRAAEAECAELSKSLVFGHQEVTSSAGPFDSGEAIASLPGGGSSSRWYSDPTPKPPACAQLGIGGVKRLAVEIVGQHLTANNIDFRHSESTLLLSIYGQPASDRKIYYIFRLDLQSFRAIQAANRVACAIDVRAFRTWRDTDNRRLREQDPVSNAIYRELMTRLSATS